MRLPITSGTFIDQLRSWFHPKDRDVVLGSGLGIRGQDTTPINNGLSIGPDGSLYPDGNIILQDDTFIEGESVATPNNPESNRGRLYWQDDYWRQLNSDGDEYILMGLPLIAETVLGASAASVTFSSIPQDFRHLLIFNHARTDNASEIDSANLIFNSDTGANYAFVELFYSSGAGGSSTNSRNNIPLSIVEAANSRADCFGGGISVIPNYSLSDVEKRAWNILSVVFGDQSAAADNRINKRAGHWRNTAAITTITYTPNAGSNFVSGSRFQLYGIL